MRAVVLFLMEKKDSSVCEKREKKVRKSAAHRPPPWSFEYDAEIFTVDIDSQQPDNHPAFVIPCILRTVDLRILDQHLVFDFRKPQRFH